MTRLIYVDSYNRLDIHAWPYPFRPSIRCDCTCIVHCTSSVPDCPLTCPQYARVFALKPNIAHQHFSLFDPLGQGRITATDVIAALALVAKAPVSEAPSFLRA